MTAKELYEKLLRLDERVQLLLKQWIKVRRILQKRTILKNSQKLIDFNVYLPSVSSGVFRHSLADSAPSGKTNKIFYGNADTYPST